MRIEILDLSRKQIAGFQNLESTGPVFKTCLTFGISTLALLLPLFNSKPKSFLFPFTYLYSPTPLTRKTQAPMERIRTANASVGNSSQRAKNTYPDIHTSPTRHNNRGLHFSLSFPDQKVLQAESKSHKTKNNR